jgi:hypothetical protein
MVNKDKIRMLASIQGLSVLINRPIENTAMFGLGLFGHKSKQNMF